MVRRHWNNGDVVESPCGILCDIIDSQQCDDTHGTNCLRLCSRRNAAVWSSTQTVLLQQGYRLFQYDEMPPRHHLEQIQ
jgi:hypothetical protein